MGARLRDRVRQNGARAGRGPGGYPAGGIGRRVPGSRRGVRRGVSGVAGQPSGRGAVDVLYMDVIHDLRVGMRVAGMVGDGRPAVRARGVGSHAMRVCPEGAAGERGRYTISAASGPDVCVGGKRSEQSFAVQGGFFDKAGGTRAGDDQQDGSRLYRATQGPQSHQRTLQV